MSISMKEHMIIPEVLADMVAGAFGSRLTLKPLAEEDNTLQGKPGDTLKFPAFRYIGKAARVDENGEVLPGLLSADTVSVSVRKFAKAVCITDEARLSGMGDPVGEAARQLAHAIDHAVDDELYEALKGVGLSRKAAIDGLTANAVADALALFGEEQDGPKVLLTDAAGFAALRKDPAYLRAGDMAQEAIFKGVVGEIWGCQVVVSNRIQDDPALAGAPAPEALEHVVAEVTTLFGVTAGAMSRELGSPVSELVALGETGGYLARRVTPELFCLFVTGATADLANVRSEAEELARDLSGAFV